MILIIRLNLLKIIMKHVKASRLEYGDVTNKRKYPATKELMITLTKDVGNDTNINILEQYDVYLQFV